MRQNVGLRDRVGTLPQKADRSGGRVLGHVSRASVKLDPQQSSWKTRVVKNA